MPVADMVALHVLQGRMRYLIDERVVTLGPNALLWAHTDQSHFLLAESADFDMWVFVLAPAHLTPKGLFPPDRASELTLRLPSAAAGTLVVTIWFFVEHGVAGSTVNWLLLMVTVLLGLLMFSKIRLKSPPAITE